jgi:hypothetical protein
MLTRVYRVTCEGAYRYEVTDKIRAPERTNEEGSLNVRKSEVAG